MKMRAPFTCNGYQVLKPNWNFENWIRELEFTVNAINSHDSMIEQIAKQQEEIERLTILSNWLIALSDNGCVINSHKFSQSELTKLLAKHKKGD